MGVRTPVQRLRRCTTARAGADLSCDSECWEQSALYQSRTQLDEQVPQLTPQIVNLPLGPALPYLACLARQATGLGIAQRLTDAHVCTYYLENKRLGGGRLEFDADRTTGQLLKPPNQITDFRLFLALIKVVAT